MNTDQQPATTCSPLVTYPSDVGEAIVLQILKVADLLTRIGDSKVFGKELTQSQFNILMILRRHGNGGISQKDILDKLVSTKGNVSIHISNLENKGYVKRRVSKKDSRLNVITLTSKGERILKELEPRYVQQLRIITVNLPREQAEAAIELLNQLRTKCQEAFGVSPPPERG